MKLRQKNTHREAPQSNKKIGVNLLLILIMSVFVINFASAFAWNPTGYYKLDEAAGVVISEEVGGRDLIGINTPTWLAGKINNGLNFTFTDSEMGYSSSVDPHYYNLGKNDWSISMWIYPHVVSGSQILVINNGNWAVRIDAGEIGFSAVANQTDGWHITPITTDANLVAKDWYHVVVTYNGTIDNSGSGLRIYINDTFHPHNGAWSVGAMPKDNGDGSFRIGGDNSTLDYPGFYYYGTIDEIGIFNRTLSVIDINDLYNAGAGLSYGGTSRGVNTLDTPINGKVITSNPTLFNASYNSTATGFNLINSTYYIWHDNGTMYNNSYVYPLVGTEDNSSVPFSFNNFGDYFWNVYACIGDGFPSNCSFVGLNNTFSYSPATIDGENYKNFTTEGSLDTFRINVTLGTGYQLSGGTLIHNGTTYAGTFSLISGNSYTISKQLEIPNVDGTTNATFFWNVTTESGVNITSSKHNQTITALAIDNCAVHPNLVFNFSLIDEATQELINATGQNSSIEIDFNLYTSNRNTLILNLSIEYGEIPFAPICIDDDLSSGASYSMDVVVKYSGLDYATEYYNIQRGTLSSATLNQEIDLFDLLTSTNQPFKIIYRDDKFLPVADALIIIQRKYVDEGVFKTVEIPKTDFNGKTIGNLVTNNVIYNFIVTKYGTVLGTFNNVRAVCQTPAISDCTIELNSFSSSIPVTNFTLENNFYYTLSHNRETRTTTATFTVLDGTASTILLNVSKADALGTSVCSTSIVTSSGTLTCVSPANIGNGTLIAQIYKDGVLMGQGTLNLQQRASELYDGMLIFLSIFILVTLIGAGLSDSPVFTIIFFMVGVILLFVLNLVDNNGFIGSTATILFLIIAIILLIIKKGGRN